MRSSISLSGRPPFRKALRENCERIKRAFAWNPGYREFFAVKACPNPSIMGILKEYGFGCDCASRAELSFAKAMGLPGDKIMFTSNVTPASEFQYAAKIGAIINFDDISHIEYCEQVEEMGKDSAIIQFKRLEEVPTAICMAHRGPYERFYESFTELFRYIEEQGYHVVGQHRIVYIDGVWNQKNPENWLSIIQVPVTKE